MRGFASKQEEIWHLKLCEGNDQSLCSRNQQISDVIYGQVWWAMLGIHALHLPIQSAHTHCKHTHCEHTPRAVGGSAPQSWYWGWREHWIFTPPTYNSCWPETRTRNLWIMSPALKPLGHDFPTQIYLSLWKRDFQSANTNIHWSLYQICLANILL